MFQHPARLPNCPASRLRAAVAGTLALAAALALGCAPGERMAVDDPPAEVMELYLDGPAAVAEWMHAPLRPRDGEAVTFRVEAAAAADVARVELYVYEYELYADRAGRPSQRRRGNGVWGQVAAWSLDVPEAGLSRAHRLDDGFGPHTRVEYVWRLIGADGAVTDRFARFDAGTSPWPRDKVLLYSASRRPMSETIDVGFFRDTDYGDSLDLYRSDVEAMVTEGFLAEATFGTRREHWAFYTTDRAANGAAISADVTNQALLPGFLKDFSIPGVDAFCLLHRESYTDRSLLLENFHSLSNNLFSAEAYNHGTAVHECGHAIFHLSDEYGGCACFQTHASSNVFREAGDCARWNAANGFPAEDCFEVRDLYDRSWYSAERPTFFATEEECRAHNRALGVDDGSCRTFVDREGAVSYWAFETTCIMHDDGDDLVRPFRRACGRVIEEFYRELPYGGGTLAAGEDRRDVSARAEAAVGLARYENVYGYEPVLELAMTREGEDWGVRVEGASFGVPTSAAAAGGEVAMRVLNAEGTSLATYYLAAPGAVHAHGDEDAFEVPSRGEVRVAVPAGGGVATVACEFDADRHGRSADPSRAPYRDAFVFDVAGAARRAVDSLRSAR